jgi:hypothetical protein
MKHKSRRYRNGHKTKKTLKNHKKKMRKSRIIRSKKTYKKYKTGIIFIGGGQRGQNVISTQQDSTSSNKFFVMDFPKKSELLKHSNIFSNMLATNSNIERNSITSDLGIISTIIIDGDFAKNDCDDIWALAYLSKNISKVNGDKPRPRLICGSLHGAVNMKSVITSDTNINKETSGLVKTRRISGLNDTVLIYILGGIDDSEVISYIDLMTNNSEATKLCFIFQTPSNWELVRADKTPSNVRSGHDKDDLQSAQDAIDCYFNLLDNISRCKNAIVVFTDFERTKRVYTIKYPPATYVPESTMIIGPSVMQYGILADQDKQDLLHNYIDSLSTTYKDYHNLVDNYEKPNPNIKFNMAISSVDGNQGILITHGSFIADLYTVYASLCNDANIIYRSISDIEFLVEV